MCSSDLLRESLATDGLNVAASRKTTGNHEVYLQLESTLARWLKAESAIATSNGYVANLIAAQGLAGCFQIAFADERAHASLLDAAKFLNCPVILYRHRDAADLKRRLVAWRKRQRKSEKHNQAVILTDGLFAHDGSIAPLRELAAAAGRNDALLVDDEIGRAHV